jgi:hypothetical protein
LHVIPHVPLTQVAPPFEGEEQTCPHAPQLLMSPLVSMHVPKHAMRGAVQVKPHVLPAQYAVPPFAGQTIPHDPQLFGSLLVFVHTVGHIVFGAVQVDMQEYVPPDAAQTVLPVQIAPQPPQLLDVLRGVSHT